MSNIHKHKNRTKWQRSQDTVTRNRRRRNRQKRKQRSSLLFGGRNSFNSMPHQDDLKKRMNRRTDAWYYERFRKLDDLLVLTTPNHVPPYQNRCSSENFSSIHPCWYIIGSDDLCLYFCLFLLLLDPPK